MAVSPFPSQALAKLVLGYLAEEQLMTAYDEFLQASPYLDALENEYDRVLMTSLRSMLAEYRSVKIYVETCTPAALRRLLLQCPNLLEIVKFLIENVDMNKILSKSTNTSGVKQNCRVLKRVCEGCNESSQNCSCNKTCNNHPKNVETTPQEHSVETTSLQDLPGHQNQIEQHQCESSLRVSRENIKKVSYNVSGLRLEPHIQDQHLGDGLHLADGQNTEFSNQQSQITNDGDDSRHKNLGLSVNERQVSKTDTFQEFTVGISGPDNGTSVPDSSTPENVQITTTKESNSLQSITVGNPILVKENLNTCYLVIDKNNISTISSTAFDNMNNITPSTNKGIEQKITILSDVKVDNTLTKSSKKSKKPKLLKNATSTPVVQMQSILINGIPAYRQDKTIQSGSFSKDEIMAMPTIIVAPASNGSSIPTVPTSQPTAPVPESLKSLEPLQINDELPPSNQPTTGLLKTVESNKKNPSVPKDNIITTSPNKMKTPQVVPVVRKSSSTPRRSTHVRVLDFATPRRILQEVITENTNEFKSESAAEVILSRSPNLAAANLDRLDSTVKSVDPNSQDASSKENTKLNPVVPIKKRDWDADLRALACSVTPNPESDKLNQPKSKPKCTRKKATEKKPRKSETKSRRRTSAKAVKSADSAIVEIIDDDEPAKDEPTNIKPVSVKKTKKTVKKTSRAIPPNTVNTIKPTINIITREDKYTMLPPESSSKKDKSSEDKKDASTEDLADTPEAERLSLQNVIGAKLNISDFLETPYKQALYDIQMETPRFLGPDIPGDPLSDIKIMNIPTPRFLTSPNTQATPSSYSSRPTDYSSGGSYYKPDDTDYIPPAELLGFPSTVNSSKEPEKAQEKPQPEKSRPVRKCTKNVSYYASRQNTSYYSCKQKESDEADHASTSSEKSISKRITPDVRTEKISKVSNEKETDKASTSKSDTSKESATKKRKTPVKKDKSFMKIKPRKSSPLICPRSKRKSITSPLKSAKKRLSTKEKEISGADTSAAPKSRRKSSTPRKLHCTKQFTSESSDHDSPDMGSKNKQDTAAEMLFTSAQESDTEYIALRWSDDCSQDGKSKVDPEDISKIREFIATTNNVEDNLHLDLINRGFDAETAKRIERDLLGTTENIKDSDKIKKDAENIETTSHSCQNESTPEPGSSNIPTEDLQNVEEEEEVEEIELSAHECCEGSSNYICIQYNEEQYAKTTAVHTLKDKFSMEICLDDDVTVRLRATAFDIIVDGNEAIDYSETQTAVFSITNFDKLYTPLKDAVRAKCSEIFDSTLTSLDTPLKATSPIMYHERTIADIVLEVEKVDVTEEVEIVKETVEKVEHVKECVEVKEKVEIKQKSEVKEKPESKKRKRAQSGVSSEDLTNSSKKTKPETQYLLNSANIQNIDIESVLKQLHGS